MRKLLIATASEAAGADFARVLSQYEVHICHTGTEALRLLDALHPDILIIDLMLPSMDGLTVLQKSKFRPGTILARTNLITPTVKRWAAEAGVQDLVLIPCSTRCITERLAALTEKVPSPEL